MRTSCSSLVISDTILKIFKDLIQQGRENFTVNCQLSPSFLHSNLCRLVRQHWLTSEVMETFVKIFNRSESNFTKIYSFLYLVDFKTNGKLKEEIIHWKAKSIGKICIVANVEMDILGNTFIANSNYDSLGWKISLNLNKTIK